MEINYKDLGLKVDKTRKSFTFNGIEIEISNYLPINDRYDLIMSTLQKSEEDLYYNEIKLDLYFHLYLIIFYTNIVFSQEELANELTLYDEIVGSGLLDAFLDNFDADEYSCLKKTLKSIADELCSARRSAGGMLENTIKNLPIQAAKAKEFIGEIDPNKIKEIFDLVNNFQQKNPNL
jgi:hypothetical protein